MQVTDEMALAAARSDAKFDGHDSFEAMSRMNRERYIARSRAALEAALRARKTKGEFVSHLLNWADVKEASCASYSTAIAREAADCIDELTRALRPLNAGLGKDDPTWDSRGLAEIEFTIGDLRRARAALEKWGLK